MFILGQVHADVKWLREEREAEKKLKDNHEDRITSLEQTRFKALSLVGMIGGAAGLAFSYLKDGIEWLKNHLV
jgi:hypothetical protein